MSQNLKMTLNAFTEEYTSLLKGYTADELRAILILMAHDIDPAARAGFIKKLVLKKIKDSPPTIQGEAILDDIDSLIEDVRAQSEEEPDWNEYHDDEEDSLAEFAEFIPLLDELFDKVEALFDYGHYDLARKAYEALFTIFDIQDDYGRGISMSDLESTDPEEARARYFRSIYLSEKPEKRVQSLLNAMTLFADLIPYARPTLQDMINISATSLPEFTVFLQQWINKTQSGTEPKHDSWFREAIGLLQGAEGLATIAKTEGKQRPRVYIDWIKALMRANNHHAALDAITYALDQIPNNNPIRAVIGDLKIACGQQLVDEKIQFDGQWISFAAKPELSKLLALHTQVDCSKRIALMQQASELIAAYKQNRGDYVTSTRNCWEFDSIEMPSSPTTSLLMHAYLFANEQQRALKLAQEGSALGWSGTNNAQPLFIAYCLVKIVNQPIHKLPASLKEFFHYALDKSKDVWLYDETHDDLIKKMETAYDELFTISSAIPNDILSWCLRAAEARVSGIVSNQHRRAYSRAALLTAACTETLKFTNQPAALQFFNGIKNKFPRHSSFQAELSRYYA